MQALALTSPEPRRRLIELKRDIAVYRLAVSTLERQIRKARKTQEQTPAVRAALDAAQEKLAIAREDLRVMTIERKALARKAR
jgi:hypothetical protein